MIKLKKILLDFLQTFVLFSMGIMLIQEPVFAVSPFVTASGRNFSSNGSVFKSIGVNRYNLMTTGGTPYIGCGGTFKDSDLVTWFSELKSMGVTSVRFWLFQEFTKSGADLSRFDYLLTLGKQYNVKLIPVFENHWKDCTQGGSKTSAWYQSGYRSPYGTYSLSLKDYIGKIVPKYANNPQIMMWQIMNEAESSDSTALYNFAKDVSGYINSLDVNHLVSFGTMGSGQAGASVYKQIHALSSVDVLEYHDYNSETTALPSTLSDRIKDSISLNKPLIIGEAGINLSDGYTTTARAGYFDNKMSAYFNNNGSLYMIWSYREVNNQDASYGFNFTDPLVKVVNKYSAVFASANQAGVTPTPTTGVTPVLTPKPTPTSAITPTGSPKPTPTATVKPTPTATVKPTPTPTGKSLTKLGGMDLNGYCVSIGKGSTATVINGIWNCTSNGPVIPMTDECKWQYKNTSAVAVQAYAGNAYSWSCYAY